jgi:hypothetical protein
VIRLLLRRGRSWVVPAKPNREGKGDSTGSS